MKKHLLVVMCMLLCSVLFAEEVLFVTTEDTPTWNEGDLYDDYYIQNITKTFPKNTKVILYADIYKFNIIDRDDCIEYRRDSYISVIIVDDKTYDIEAKNIIPIDTPDLFDESFLTVAHYPSNYLLPSYFTDVLKSGTRSTMSKYEKDFIKAQGGDNPGEYDPFWWELSEITKESIITQSFLRIKLLGKFLVKQIEKIPNGYKVEVKRTKMVFEESFFPPDRLEYSLFFQFDGDYVDIYIDSLSNKVLSLTYVSSAFYEGVKTVISDDVAVDLSNLIFPRRADGSSDYDDDIIPRQELPQIDRDPLQGMFLVVDETTTLEEVKEAIKKSGSANLVNKKSEGGITPLQIAVSSNANLEIIKFLIELQDDVDETLLVWALESSPEIISILLNAGSSLDTVDNRPYSANRGSNILGIANNKIFSELEKMGWEDNSDDKIIWQERGKIYDTTDNLRLRATEGVTGEPLFTLPKDTPVKILSIGKIEKIDEIFAYWVEVEVAEDTVDIDGNEVKKGAVGWCFGGYLTNENLAYEALSVVPPKIVPVAVAEVSTVATVAITEVKEALPEVENTEKTTTAQDIPIAVWLLIGGGVLLLGTIGVVVIRKKKK